MSLEPCKNPQCKSYGKPHPNCRCYAEGGEVGPHHPSCEYFADGGPVGEQYQPASPQISIGHAAVQHGLLGLMKNVGYASMNDPDKHDRILHDAKSHHEPRGENQKKSVGHKLGEHLANNRGEEAADVMHGHPIVSGIGKNNLNHIMSRMGPTILQNEPNPMALKSSAQYLNGALKGHDEIKMHTGNFFEKQKASDRMKPDEKSRENLKEYLQEIQENPEKALDVGGDIGHYLPDHAVAMGNLTAAATNYFSSLKPTISQTRPMDIATPPDKVAMQQYNRQIDIAQKPQLALQHIKDGTIIPQDVMTIQTLYPALYKTMTDEMTEQLIKAKNKDVEIPYREKQALSIFLNEPLDSTMTPAAAQAIMASAGPQQMQNQQKGKASSDKATAVEMSAIDKTDKLERTTLEARQIDRVSK